MSDINSSRYLELYSDGSKTKYPERAIGLAQLTLEIIRQSNKLSLETLSKHQCSYERLSNLIDVMLNLCLDPVEKNIVIIYYGLDIRHPSRRTMTEVADAIGCTSNATFRMFEKAIRKLRAPYFIGELEKLLNL